MRWVWLILLLLTAPAKAAEIFTSNYGDGSYLIGINGKILKEDIDKFKTIAAGIPETSKVQVLLTSKGGAVNGLEIGRIIHKRGFQTVASDYCSSMCALIWLASSNRGLYKGTLIGFHAVGDHCADTSGCANVSAVGNALVGAYLNELGFGEVAIRYMTEEPPPKVKWLTPQAAWQYNINYEFYQLP